MDHPALNPLLVLAVLILFGYSSVSFAATPTTFETGLFFAADGTMYYKTTGGSSILAYPDLQTTKDVNVNTSKGAQSLTVTRTPKIDLGRVGAAVMGFAKLLGPVGVGITVAQLIYTQAKLCDSNGVWQKQADPALSGYPVKIPNSYYFWSSLNFADGSARFPTAAIACDRFRVYRDTTTPSVAPHTSSMTSATNCRAINVLNQITDWTIVKTDGVCPFLYIGVAGECVLNGDPLPVPARESDWTAAKTALSTSNFVQPLLDHGEAVPVFVPPKIPMIEKVIDTQTVPTTDAQGNITGSQVTTTKLQATDESTAASPNTFNITESTTVNNYNTSNVLTSTTTTLANPPPPVTPTADPTTFDDVSDVPIVTKQVNPGDMDTTSWGDGECPASVSISTHLFGSHEIPMNRACEFAVGVKPVVLLIASLAALFIVAGVRTSEN